MLDAVQNLENLSLWLQDRAAEDPNSVGSACFLYLQLFGYVAYAYMWPRMARVAQARLEADEDFHSAKLASAAFYFNRLLPRIAGPQASIRASSESLYRLRAEQS
ncbi:acyl-CoA dehydrogenase C-terminal domain-containing protein [Pseudomonas sp. P5_109]|uniref:acyl-CoA dehydrogenase C-terminal domain-containing protein n=1 Tax=unclassified Pseudomonas TaxID=196821 RepID=UPI0021DA31AF|nr:MULTISPECIES: acyl-CoA dehydrogenase C-terminal domain-containing protein [unclassified Pseudomonas]WPN33160.1 acyl-CoA dehydrogenase C-terminal domain-containing protein [Pseudomonas sp. P5_109]